MPSPEIPDPSCRRLGRGCRGRENPAEPMFAASPLEETGFELFVPLPDLRHAARDSKRRAGKSRPLADWARRLRLLHRVSRKAGANSPNLRWTSPCAGLDCAPRS